MCSKLIKLSFLILTLSLTLIYINQKTNEDKNTISVDVNITDMNKIDEVFHDLGFLKFHSAVQKIEFLEQIKKEEKLFDIYEITEEAKVLGGFYNFYSKNKMQVNKINKHNFITNIRMKLLGFFDIEFNTEFIAFFNEDKKSIRVEERKILKGPSLLLPIVSKVAEDFHIIMFNKMKKSLEN